MSLLQEVVKKVNAKDKLFFTVIQFAIEALCSVDVSQDEKKAMGKELQGQLKDDDDIKHKCEDIFYTIVDIVETAVQKEFSSTMSSYMGQQLKELEVILH